VWTDANEIFTFGSGFDREFGHLDVDEEDEEEEDPFGLLDGRETLKPPKDHCRSHGSRRIEPSEGPAPRLLPRLVEALLDKRQPMSPPPLIIASLTPKSDYY